MQEAGKWTCAAPSRRGSGVASSNNTLAPRAQSRGQTRTIAPEASEDPSGADDSVYNRSRLLQSCFGAQPSFGRQHKANNGPRVFSLGHCRVQRKRAFCQLCLLCPAPSSMLGFAIAGESYPALPRNRRASIVTQPTKAAQKRAIPRQDCAKTPQKTGGPQAFSTEH